MFSVIKVLPVAMALCPLSAFASVQYWSRSDKCEGQPNGIIEVVGSDPNSAGCVAIGGDGSVWSIKVEGTCINVNDNNCKPIFR